MPAPISKHQKPSLINKDDIWQKRSFERDAQLETSFWFGEDNRTFEPSQDFQHAATPKQMLRTKARLKPATTQKESEPAAMKKSAKSPLSLGEELLKAVNNINALISKTDNNGERSQLTRQQVQIKGQAEVVINQTLDEDWTEYAEATKALKAANTEAEIAQERRDKIASSIKKFATAIDKLELLEKVNSGKVPGKKADPKQIKTQKTPKLAATKETARLSMEYLVVHFPRSRRVLIDDEFNGRTEELIEVEAGRHTVSLGPPYDNYGPDQYTIVLKDTSTLEPREVTFEMIAGASSDERNEATFLRKNIARKMKKK